jgi:2-C-methyl-D-erythritol 4-phosphate cytidylyltransferase
MRIREIITEDAIDEILEDEAADPAILDLMNILETMRNRAHDTHAVPRVRTDSLINLVQIQHPQFTLDTLDQALSNNESLKALVKDIKDDATGVKYVYLTPFADDDEEAAIGDPNAPRTPPERTVDSMAKSALAKRS